MRHLPNLATTNKGSLDNVATNHHMTFIRRNNSHLRTFTHRCYNHPITFTLRSYSVQAPRDLYTMKQTPTRTIAQRSSYDNLRAFGRRSYAHLIKDLSTTYLQPYGGCHFNCEISLRAWNQLGYWLYLYSIKILDLMPTTVWHHLPLLSIYPPKKGKCCYFRNFYN